MDSREGAPTARRACPSCASLGEQDPLAPPSLARELAAAIPGARLEVMPDAPHSLNLERQIEFNRLLHAFLASSQ